MLERTADAIQREASAHLAIDAARVLLDDFRDQLTPHLMERCLQVTKHSPETIHPELAASMCRLAIRIMGRRI